MDICDSGNCILPKGHSGKHYNIDKGFMKSLQDLDKKKVEKSGYATPRGGGSNGYQNHVNRNNRVIIPFEKLSDVTLENYLDGYVIRLLPSQAFKSSGVLKEDIYSDINLPDDSSGFNIIIGQNAFILYKTINDFNDYPPLKDWVSCYLELNGVKVATRKNSPKDKGHYLTRYTIPTGGKKKPINVNEGPPQGIFAPEYSDQKTNILSMMFLAWLIYNTEDSPYGKFPKEYEDILKLHGLLDEERLESSKILVDKKTACPLCGEVIKYSELHETINLSGALGQSNSSDQVKDRTRSTKINLFHMKPLLYGELNHKPEFLAWGHAICNSRLGQYENHSYSSLKQTGSVLTTADGNEFGWISDDKSMIRTANDEVWIRITDINNKE